MKILGLNDDIDAGAALIEKGKVRAAMSEARLIRKRAVSGLPELAIDEVLRLAETEPVKIGLVAVATADAPATSGVISRVAQLFRGPVESFYRRELRRRLRERGFRCDIVFIERSRAQAAGAYYTSGFEEATVVALDAGGAGRAFVARRRKLLDVDSTDAPAPRRDGAASFVAWAVGRTGAGDLAVGGPAAAEPDILRRCADVPGVTALSVLPGSDDAALSVGAAYAAWAERFPIEVNLFEPYRPGTLEFGTGYSDADFRRALETGGCPHEFVDDIETRVATLLAQGRVVARFDGKMEFGAGALGNRSVLFAPADPGAGDWMGKRLGRTGLSPFIALTLIDYAGECFHAWEKSAQAGRFAAVALACTGWMKRRCPAAIAADGTARPRFVDRDLDPALFRIVDAYRRITGLPGLVSIDLDFPDEPPVRTPQEALRALRQGRLDFLALGNHLVWPVRAQARSQESAAPARERRQAVRPAVSGRRQLTPTLAPAYFSAVPGK